MPNLLLSEYDARLAEVAALWGADGGAHIRSHEASWTVPLGGVSVGITLESYVGGGYDSLRPQAQIGMTRGLPRDAGQALAVVEESST